MNPQQFAVAIVFPGAGAADIVGAAIKNEVHIIDKENYDTGKDYKQYSDTYQPYTNGSRILLLFVFTQGFSILADSMEKLNMAMEKIMTVAN